MTRYQVVTRDLELLIRIRTSIKFRNLKSTFTKFISIKMNRATPMTLNILTFICYIDDIKLIFWGSTFIAQRVVAIRLLNSYLRSLQIISLQLIRQT